MMDMDARDVLAQHTTSDYTDYQCHCAEHFYGPEDAWADHVILALTRAGYRIATEGLIDRQRMENIALREMLEAAESQIHGEWGVGSRESCDWLPELEQHICGQKTGHQPTRRVERRWTYNGRDHHCIETKCQLCDVWISEEELDEE